MHSPPMLNISWKRNFPWPPIEKIRKLCNYHKRQWTLFLVFSKNVHFVWIDMIMHDLNEYQRSRKLSETKQRKQIASTEDLIISIIVADHVVCLNTFKTMPAFSRSWLNQICTHAVRKRRLFLSLIQSYYQ